ncbi:1-phosphatidylinositol-4,5-bisphosphate phosphodiesterase [Fusarium heterosporum]|uniref:Phosphoinositide phospholipase C n=1 Tax=Fusarium heterosporum TaxID=42747 RepID=A0A8H5WTZ2_FUSHE|nr:1-phosphatidylinositol-4,5-bisphosphate phosphodiesterase [Fusarium heterosporum]
MVIASFAFTPPPVLCSVAVLHSIYCDAFPRKVDDLPSLTVMDLMNLRARDLSNKCLETFQQCTTFCSTVSRSLNQSVSHYEQFEYRLADFNLWIDGIGALAPSKASLDSRLNERQIDLSLVKGNLVMLLQSLQDCMNLLKSQEPFEESLLDIDSALESLVSLSLAIRRTGRRSRLHKADRLFNPEDHNELKRHLEAIILLRPGAGPCSRDDEFRKKMNSLSPVQQHLVMANLKRRNRYIQAHLHSLGLKKRIVEVELPVPETSKQDSTPAIASKSKLVTAAVPPTPRIPQKPNQAFVAPRSVTSASIPEIYPNMSGMMDHLHDTHPTAVQEDISAILSSSTQAKMSIKSCPLCEIQGDVDSPDLIDHVLEHIHDFSLRSLPWPISSDVDLGGEVGSFNPECEAAVTVAEWLGGYEHETVDTEPTLKLSSYDYGRLAVIAEEIKSGHQDKFGLDIYFADEHGDESAEAETDVSQLTRTTLDSLKEVGQLGEADDGYSEGYRNEPDKKDTAGRQSSTGLGKLTSRIFSRNKGKNLGTVNDPKVAGILVHLPELSQQAFNVLSKLYQRRIDSLIRRKSLFREFIEDVQGEEIVSTDSPVLDLASFLQVMVESHLHPLKPLPPKDLTKKIHEYFINTSRQTLLSRASSNSHSSLDSIREALQTGYRSIDIEVWDGVDDDTDEVQGIDSNVLYEPPYPSSRSARALHATESQGPMITLSQPEESIPQIKPVVKGSWPLSETFSFFDFCATIRKYGFINNTMPIIVNFTVSASPDQQQMMVEIMKEAWRGFLVDEPLDDCNPNLELPRLQDLQERILVRVSGPANSATAQDISLDDDDRDSFLIPSLSSLGVYLQGRPLKSLHSPQTVSPTCVCSGQEDDFNELVSEAPVIVFKYTLERIWRVDPEPSMFDRTNLDPLQYWKYGVQMAAINHLKVDEGSMLNSGIFQDELGWVLKPTSHRWLHQEPLSAMEAAQIRIGTLSIFLFQDQTFQLMAHDGTKKQTKDFSQLVSMTMHSNGLEYVFPRQRHAVMDNDSGALGYIMAVGIDDPFSSKLSIIKSVPLLVVDKANKIPQHDIFRSVLWRRLACLGESTL